MGVGVEGGATFPNATVAGVFGEVAYSTPALEVSLMAGLGALVRIATYDDLVVERSVTRLQWRLMAEVRGRIEGTRWIGFGAGVLDRYTYLRESALGSTRVTRTWDFRPALAFGPAVGTTLPISRHVDLELSSRALVTVFTRAPIPSDVSGETVGATVVAAVAFRDR